ncbi:MAG TPA: SRPBCC family protein, partial [Gaiellaceae bacterium]|nr:SRPBCC family protein [Gaiellaceae bacterium]
MSTQAAETEAIRRSVTVDCSIEHAFATFTERIHDWWPLGTHSIDQYETGTPAETVVFQGGAGGQVYERTKKGEELKWADVVAYDPPRRFVLAWNPSREQDEPQTEIEVTFTDEAGKTRVDLEHRGWERLGDRADEARQGYSQGWQSVLAGYADTVGSS